MKKLIGQDDIIGMSDKNLEKYILRVSGDHPDSRININGAVFCSDQLRCSVEQQRCLNLNKAFIEAGARNSAIRLTR